MKNHQKHDTAQSVQTSDRLSIFIYIYIYMKKRPKTRYPAMCFNKNQ